MSNDKVHSYKPFPEHCRSRKRRVSSSSFIIRYSVFDILRFSSASYPTAVYRTHSIPYCSPRKSNRLWHYD